MNVFQPRTPAELQQRLAAMKLASWCFENTLVAGHAESVSYSQGAPIMAAEMGRWLRSVEELHNGITALQQSWERSDPNSQPTWVNAATNTAIVVSSGDENTGQVTFSQPSNRNPKGRSFGVLVEANNDPRLFDAVSAAGALVDVNETWVYLYDAREGFVYSELSLPVLMPGSRITGWRERILFPRFDTGTGTFEKRDDGPQQDFSFTIQRR